MEIFAGTCAILGERETRISRAKKKKNSNHLTDKYCEEKFDVTSLYFFSSPQAAHYFP